MKVDGASSSLPTPTYFTEPGRGPGTFGKLWSVAATAGNYAKGLVGSNTIERAADEEEQVFIGMFDRLQNAGKMLTSTDIILFFQGLSKKIGNSQQFLYCTKFVDAPITRFSLDEVKGIVNKFLEK